MNLCTYYMKRTISKTLFYTLVVNINIFVWINYDDLTQLAIYRLNHKYHLLAC